MASCCATASSMTSRPRARQPGADTLAGQRARSASARGDSARRCGPHGRLHLLGVVDRPGEALDQLIGGVLVAEMNGVDALVEQDWRLVTWVVDETAVGGSAAVRRLGHDDDPCHELSPFGSRMGSQTALRR